MTDIPERPKINPRCIAYFGDNLPVSALVEVKGLVDPRMKVEIECQAYVEWQWARWFRRGGRRFQNATKSCALRSKLTIRLPSQRGAS
jgi:hypothetical protein